MTLTQPELITADRLPHTTLRTTEIYLRNQVFKVEDRAVRRLLTLYRAAFQELRTRLLDLAGQYPRGSTAWRTAFENTVSARINRLKIDVLAETERSARTALLGAYLGRLWLLDMSTRAEVVVKTPVPTPDLLREAIELREDVYDSLIRDLLGQDWRAQYEVELDDLIIGIRRAVGQGLINGEGMDDIARRVRDAMGVTTDRRRGAVGSAQRAGYRANFNRVQTLTRTLVQKTANDGAIAAYRANSDILNGYEWVTAHDERTCPICRPLDGQRFGMKSNFRPPIHPNCILPGNEVVLPGDLVGAAKSHYVGRAIEITFGDGSVLRVTENHPILTPLGWIHAKELRESDHVIRSVDSQRIFQAINPNDDYRPTVIEQIFSSFMERGGVFTTRMKLAAEDFYGDARFFDSNVDIVNVNRLLLSNGESIMQPERELSFGDNSTGAVTFTGNGASLALFDRDIAPTCGFMGGELVCQHLSPVLLPADVHGSPDAARFNASFEQMPADNIARDAAFFGEGLLRDTSPITGDDIIQIGQLRSMPAYFDVGSVKHPLNSLGINPKLAGDFVNRFARLIFSDPVVGIRIFQYSGHVYDLQVDPYELYICNGVIVKNCRCAIIPWIKADAFENPKAAPRATFRKWLQGYGMEKVLADFLVGGG